MSLRPNMVRAETMHLRAHPLPKEIRENMASWYGCIAGALDYRDYKSLLEETGFIDVEIQPVKMQMSDVEDMLERSGCTCEEQSDHDTERQAYFMVDGELKPIDLGGANPPFSARITAHKALD